MDENYSLQIDGVTVSPIKINGDVRAYVNPNFTLQKRSWQPDNEASICLACKKSFGPMRRKHHCRVCCLIYCDKCCNVKVPLPQLGESEPNRVCVVCLTVVTLVTKSFSPDPEFLYEAASGLYQQCQTAANVREMFASGGLYALLAVAKKMLGKHNETTGKVVGAFHTLMMYEQLHNFMVEEGVIDALCDIITKVDQSQEQILLDGVSALSIFYKTGNKSKEMHTQVMGIVLDLCGNHSSTVALVAVNVLSLVVEHLDTQTLIMKSDSHALNTMVSLCASENDQMQAVALKCLSLISMGASSHQHRIIQEDYTFGKPSLSALQKTNNMQVSCNAACLIANLATNHSDQGVLQEHKEGLIAMLNSKAVSNTDLLVHVIRGIANFAKFQENASTMLSTISPIINHCKNHESTTVRRHGLRAILNLLNSEPAVTSKKLLQDGADTVLQLLVEIPGLLDGVLNTLITQQSERARPM